MKKLISVIAMFVIGVVAYGQVAHFEGSLQEAIAKAKEENKTVMVMASATWCGPCKGIKANIYPTKEAGDFMNERVILKEYDLDKADPDNIAATFAIKAYPTFILLDANGVEINRFLGGAASVQEFLGRLESALNPENSHAAFRKRFEADKSTGEAYIQHLNDVYMTELVGGVVTEMFETRDIKENFSKESLEMYKGIINSQDNNILQYMLDSKNAKKVKKVMGKKEYEEYLSTISTLIFSSIALNRNFDKVAFDNYLAFTKANPVMNNDYANFVRENSEAIISRDPKSIVHKIESYAKNANEDTIERWLGFLGFVPKEALGEYIDSFITLYNMAAEKTVNNLRNKQMFQQYAQYFQQAKANL